jgi:isochorismate synthase
MQLYTHKAVLYAGAGITADSDPQKEWAETELKCSTLLNAFIQE